MFALQLLLTLWCLKFQRILTKYKLADFYIKVTYKLESTYMSNIFEFLQIFGIVVTLQ